MAGERAQDSRSEPAFVEWFERGESEALRLLYERYASRLRVYCLRRLGNVNDADDAVQETFLKAQRGLHRFDRNAAFWPWLVTIAARVCTDMHRLHEHMAEGNVDSGPSLDPEEEAAVRAKVAIVDDALRSMPARYRTSLYLRHFEGSSYEEIAQSQGVSLASVRTTLMRARRQLGDRIETLARAERQWPLPSTVSVLARQVRDRVRSWYHDVARVVQGFIGVLDSTASFNAVMANAPAAIVAIGALATMLSGGDLLGPLLPKALPAEPAVVGIGGTSAGPILTIGDRRTGVAIGGGNAPASPFFVWEAPNAPLAPEGSVPRTRATVADDEHGGMQIYIEVLGTRHEMWTDCTEPLETVRCTAARTMLPMVDDHEPETPGLYDLGQRPAPMPAS